MQVRFCGIHDSSYQELINDTSTTLMPGKNTITDHLGRWKVLTLEKNISLGRSIYLVLKVAVLAAVSFGLLLILPSIRADWSSAMTGKVTIEALIPKKVSNKFEVNQENSYKKDSSETIKEFRAQVFKDTCLAFEHGYRLKGKTVAIDNKPMQIGTIVYESLNELAPLRDNDLYETQFSVVNDDTLNVLLKMKAEGENPVGINMANAFRRGGGVDTGCSAQEEALSRRSNYMMIRDLPHAQVQLSEGGIYSPHVLVFREDESKNLAFMEKPEEVALVAVAAYDFGSNSKDRIEHGIPVEGPLDADMLLSNIGYTDGTKARMRNMLRAMALNGHTAIVLGALGCGAFKNPPKAVADLFGEVFLEEEFYGRFDKVCFAVLRQFSSDEENVNAFADLCNNLNT